MSVCIVPLAFLRLVAASAVHPVVLLEAKDAVTEDTVFFKCLQRLQCLSKSYQLTAGKVVELAQRVFSPHTGKICLANSGRKKLRHFLPSLSMP